MYIGIFNDKQIGFNNGQINRDFLKGKYLLNDRLESIGRIISYHITTDKNTSIQNARYFRVEVLSTGKHTNWFIDSKNNSLNYDLSFIPNKAIDGILALTK